MCARLQAAAVLDMLVALKNRGILGRFHFKLFADMSHLVAPTSYLVVRSMAVASTLALATSASTRWARFPHTLLAPCAPASNMTTYA